jgi:hypothetical protein
MIVSSAMLSSWFWPSFGVSVRRISFGELLKPRKLRLSFNAAAVAMNLFKLNRDVT